MSKWQGDECPNCRCRWSRGEHWLRRRDCDGESDRWTRSRSRNSKCHWRSDLLRRSCRRRNCSCSACIAVSRIIPPRRIRPQNSLHIRSPWIMSRVRVSARVEGLVREQFERMPLAAVLTEILLFGGRVAVRGTAPAPANRGEGERGVGWGRICCSGRRER